MFLSDTFVIHDQSLYSTWVHVLCVLRLTDVECNIKPYREQEDQRLFNPIMTQPQRNCCFHPPVPPSSVQIQDQRLRPSDLHSCQLTLLTEAPEDSQCHGPRNFFTYCIIALLASQEFRNYALLPLHLIYSSDRAVILAQKWTIKEKRIAATPPAINYILLLR